VALARFAARLGCDVYASDLNPVASMLTWGALEIVGGSAESRARLATDQQALVRQVRAEIDQLAVETDGSGWNAKAFLYCALVSPAKKRLWMTSSRLHAKPRTNAWCLWAFPNGTGRS
jgi:hypothetical protein